jgi:hypothetical protein
MSLYDELQNVAADVLGEFKQGVIKYIEVVPGSGPADDPGESTENEFTLDATANGVKAEYVQNGLAVAGNLQIVASVKGLNSSNETVDVIPSDDGNGFVTIDGVRYKVKKVLPKPAAGTPVAHILIIER